MPIIPEVSPSEEYTVGYLIERTYDQMLGANREDINQLAGPMGVDDTTFTLNYQPKRIGPGSYVEIDEETMYVWDTTPGSGSSTVCTVQRAMKGTVAQSHSALALCYVNPFFSRYQVRMTLQEEIRSWGPQIFQVASIDIDASNFVRGYDAPALADAFFLIDTQKQPGNIFATPPEQGWPSVRAKLIHNANTTAFPSGTAVIITDQVGVFDSPVYHVIYATPIDVDTSFNEGDSVITMGVSTSALDIVPLGAAWRLMQSREARRSLTENMGVNADLQNFPPGYAVQASERMKQVHDQRISDEIQRLRSLYPVKRF